MKCIISLGMLIVFAFNCITVNASLLSEKIIENEENVQVKDSFSDDILQKNLFEIDKVQKCSEISESISVSRHMQKSNPIKIDNSEALFVKNCVIVKSLQDIAFDTSEVISAVQYDDIYYIQYKTVEAAQRAIENFEQYPSVVFAETDESVSFDAIPMYSTQYASPLIGKDGYMHLSWGITQTGLDIFADYVSKYSTGTVDIAVVDTGVYTSHPFLQDYISSVQYDLIEIDAWADDGYGHGTFVTGVIVDAMQKLDFNIIPIKVGDANGGSTVSTVAYGIRQAVVAGADVINLSWGKNIVLWDYDAIHDAIEYAIANNVVVVVAAGNSNANTSTQCPAHMNEPIIVSGIDKNGDKYADGNWGGSVDVAGPGVGIKSCAIPSDSSTGYGISEGTSVAASYVTAAVAMLRLLYPTYSVEMIQNIINTCVDDVGVPGIDNKFGHGLMKISNRILTIQFTDVSKTDYYYNGVYSGYGRGYISGLTSTTFGPTANMQRQDVAVVLYKMAGSPNVVYRNVFSDVSAGHYFAKAAVWAHDNDIMSGLVGGSLGVGQPITRQDFACILYNYAQYRGLDTSGIDLLDGYPDSGSVNGYALAPVGWAVEHGIMGNDQYLWPLDNIYRRDVALMIYKFLCL